MKKLKSLEHAFEVMGLDIAKMPDFSMALPEDQGALLAHYQLTVAIRAQNKINGDWKADWSNYSQWKYYPWLNVKADKKRPSGVGLSFHDCVGTGSGTAVGSRLCTFSPESAEFLFKKFKKLYEAYFLFLNK